MAENSQPKKKRGPGRPFAPGMSGNAGGRPKSTLSKTLEKVLGDKYELGKFTNEEALCQAIVKDAINGDREMRNLIWDRREGKVSQPVGFQSPDGSPLKFSLSLGDGAAE